MILISMIFPNPLFLTPPLDIQQQIVENGDSQQNLRDELQESELTMQKHRLVNAFYTEVKAQL